MTKEELMFEIMKMTVSERREFLIDFKRKNGLYRAIDEYGFIEGDRTIIGFNKNLNFNELVVLGYLSLSTHKNIDKKLMCKKLDMSMQKVNRCIRKLKEENYYVENVLITKNKNEDMGFVVIDECILSLPVSPTAKLLYSYLVEWNEEELQVSNSKIKSDVGIGQTSIAKYLKELVENGLIIVEIKDVVGASKRIIKIKGVK